MRPAAGATPRPSPPPLSCTRALRRCEGSSEHIFRAAPGGSLTIAASSLTSATWLSGNFSPPSVAGRSEMFGTQFDNEWQEPHRRSELVERNRLLRLSSGVRDSRAVTFRGLELPEPGTLDAGRQPPPHSSFEDTGEPWLTPCPDGSQPAMPEKSPPAPAP